MLSEATINLAIELSASSWLVAARLPEAEKSRLHRIEGGDTTALLALITELRSQASTKLGRTVNVVCCFEAGRDGFWLHRVLTAHGVNSYVLEPTSILVNRRARRAKTDRLDAAHSSDDDQPFQLIVITDSGDRDHDVHPARGALGGQHDVVSDRYH
jgi:transposase